MFLDFTKQISWIDILKATIISAITCYVLVAFLNPYTTPLSAFLFSSFVGAIYLGRKQLIWPIMHTFLFVAFVCLIIHCILLLTFLFRFGSNDILRLFLNTSITLFWNTAIGLVPGLIGFYIGSRIPEKVITKLTNPSTEQLYRYYKTHNGEVQVLEEKETKMVVKATLPRKKPKYYVIINGIVVHELDYKPRSLLF